MTHLKSLAVATTLATMVCTSVLARDTVIGLSTNQNSDVLKTQLEIAIDHVVRTVKPGQQAIFFDATAAQLIGTFTVPAGAAYTNPKAILQFNRALLGQLKQVIDRAEAAPGREGQIDLPGFLRTVRENYPTGEAGADMIVLGSPIKHDPQAPSISMLGGRVFNDGHIAARAGQSDYATIGLSGTLQGYDIYLGLIGPDWSVSTQHEYHVERALTLMVEGHGGSVAYIGDDLGTLFARAGEDAPDRSHPEPLVPTDKLEMLTFAPDNGAVADIYTQPLQVVPAPEPVWRSASGVRIGITWDCNACDLDLYVRPNPSAPVIFFEQAQTAEGRLYKDFRNSPATGFETVALSQPVDLSQLKVALNFYGGQAINTPVTGELRIAIGDQIWASPFSFAVSGGNKGKGAESAIVDGVAPNDHWIILDPMTVLGSR